MNKSNALTNKERDPGMVDWTAVIVLRGEPMTSGFMRWSRHALVVMLLVAATAAGAAATAGWIAYQRGDFAAARAAYEHDARLGDRLAQFNLATMLLRGEGGAADPASGVHWLRGR